MEIGNEAISRIGDRMELNFYQKAARKTAVYPSGYKILYPTLGLCGEAGEFAEKIKKWLRDELSMIPSEDRRKQMALELGDVLWYVANVACDLDMTLDDIATKNLEKLVSRENRNTIHGDGDNR